MTKHAFISCIKWLATIVLLTVGVTVIRYFCIESFHVSTDSMETAVYKGDYILVNKLPINGNPRRNRVVLFHSPLLKDSIASPLFLSRCIGMPGDTIRISHEGYRVNGQLIPPSPRSLNRYIITQAGKEELTAVLNRFNLPIREMREESFGYSLYLTSFEEYQIREELSEDTNIHFIKDKTHSYELVVPQKGKAYYLNETILTACREAIQAEAGKRAVFKEGKLFLDGKETTFFFFRQDYYWMLSDNVDEAIDSRHLGFIPKSHIVGNATYCWYSQDKQRIFKSID